MRKNRKWGTLIELYAASELFAFNFQVFKSNSLSLYCSCQHSDSFPTLYLEYKDGNHFNLLFLKKNEKIKIENKEGKTFKEFLKEKTIKNSLKPLYKTQENLDKIQNQEKTSKSIKITLKKEIKTVHRAIYPSARNNSNNYNEIFKFYRKQDSRKISSIGFS